MRDLTLFRMGFLGAVRGWEGGAFLAPLPKICHTYPIMMKVGRVIPYLRKVKKIYKSRDTVLLTSAFFHRKSVNSVTSRYTDVD